MLVSYFTENAVSRVTVLKWISAQSQESQRLRAEQPTVFSEAEDTFVFFALVRQQLRATSESHIRPGPWTGLNVLGVNMQFGSHTVLYTLGRRPLLWYLMVLYGAFTTRLPKLNYVEVFLGRKLCFMEKIFYIIHILLPAWVAWKSQNN